MRHEFTVTSMLSECSSMEIFFFCISVAKNFSEGRVFFPLLSYFLSFIIAIAIVNNNYRIMQTCCMWLEIYKPIFLTRSNFNDLLKNVPLRGCKNGTKKWTFFMGDNTHINGFNLNENEICERSRLLQLQVIIRMICGFQFCFCVATFRKQYLYQQMIFAFKALKHLLASCAFNFFSEKLLY